MVTTAGDSFARHGELQQVALGNIWKFSPNVQDCDCEPGRADGMTMS